ncbi:hypothetical protein WN944_027282 [Citrus x changshan-huyou]|uniref:Uncharacterized protein n=1 Tax=Citrus x changshan-huyou TaxID=2935761 RepID=A0AAP0LHQ6_9ROSI
MNSNFIASSKNSSHLIKKKMLPPTVTVAHWHHLFSFADLAWHAALLGCSISSAVSTTVSNSPSPLSQPPSLYHHSHHYQPQSSAMSDNVEINSSSGLVLSRNVEDKTDNEVEEISVSTVNDKKSKEETRKKKKVSEAWEHFTKIMVNGEQKVKSMHCSAILKAK